MRKLFLLLVVFVLMWSSLAPAAISQAAPGDISVVSSSHENKFPNEIVFSLQARSSYEIKKVTLYYKVAGATVLSYAYPSITPGNLVSTQYSLNTQKTYIPPSTEISYQWQIDDAAGNSLKTDFTTFSADDVRFKWNQLTREGVTIYWYKGTESFANELLDSAAASIKRLSSEIGITYERPMKIIVYASKADMDPAIPKKSETYDRQTVTLGVRLSADVLALLGSQGDVKETLAHELSHMVVHQLVDNPYGDIPNWLDEGLSMVAEGELPSGYKRPLEDAISRDDVFSVRSMTSYSGDPSKVGLYYGQSYSIVRYLLDTYGRDKMVQLLKVYKEGTATDTALRTVYGFTTDELDAKWRQSVGLGPRQSQDSTSKPNVTPVPTLVPFGTSSQTEFGSTFVMALAAFALCASVIAVVAVIVILIMFLRRGR